MPLQLSQLNPASGCTACKELVTGRQSVVWARGPEQAEIMLIGEAPGGNEDREARPFIGRSGKFGDDLLRQAGIDPAGVHFANTVMCRPPGNRDPEPEEVANCRPWLTQHIRMVDPLGVILVGRFAIGSFFQQREVAATEGLMYLETCDACGLRAHTHSKLEKFGVQKLWAQDGAVSLDPLNRCRLPTFRRRRVYAATYHPAAAMRKADFVPHVLGTLRRLKAEVDLLKQERERTPS